MQCVPEAGHERDSVPGSSDEARFVIKDGRVRAEVSLADSGSRFLQVEVFDARGVRVRKEAFFLNGYKHGWGNSPRGSRPSKAAASPTVDAAPK